MRKALASAFVVLACAASAPAAASATTFYAAPLPGTGTSGGDCTETDPCWPQEAVTAALASDPAPDEVRLAAGVYDTSANGTLDIASIPDTVGALTIKGAGEADTILTGVAPEATVRLGITGAGPPPGDFTLQDLRVRTPAAAPSSTHAVESTLGRLRLLRVAIRFLSADTSVGLFARNGVYVPRSDSELVADDVDIDTAPTPFAASNPSGPGIHAFGPLTVRDSTIDISNTDTSGQVAAIRARGDVTVQRTQADGGQVGLYLVQPDGQPPVHGLIDSSLITGINIGIRFDPAEGIPARLAVRNSEARVYGLQQRVSINTIHRPTGQGEITIDSSILKDYVAIACLPSGGVVRCSSPPSPGTSVVACTYSYVLQDEPECPEASNIHQSSGVIDGGNPAPLTAAESGRDVLGLPRVAGCVPRRDIGAYEAQPSGCGGAPGTPDSTGGGGGSGGGTAQRIGRAAAAAAAVRFTLTRAARVTVTVTQKVAGRKKGKRCVAKRKKGKRCKATVVKLRRVLSGKTGANRLKLPKLKPGRYTVKIATAGAATVTRSFTVKRAKRKKR